MGLRVLHSADWHMDSLFAGLDPERRAYLKRKQREIPGRIAEICRREHCDLVLLSGDIFDSPTCRDSADSVRGALESCGVPVLIAPGNHDYLTSGSPWLEMQWPENVYIFTAGLQSITLPQLDCKIYGAGYRSMDCGPLLDNFRAEGEETYQLAVLHGDPMRPASPYCPVTSAQARDSGLSYLALGHIHKSGSFRAGKTLCGWPGAPMGRGFDETGEKGVYILDLQEEATCRFVELDTPQFHDIRLDTDRENPEQLLPAADRGDFWRVTLTGSSGADLAELRDRFAYLKNLEFIDNRTPRSDPWERLEEDTLEGAYFRLLRSRLEEAEGTDREIIQLAAELSRDLLEGREVVL